MEVITENQNSKVDELIDISVDIFQFFFDETPNKSLYENQISKILESHSQTEIISQIHMFSDALAIVQKRPTFFTEHMNSFLDRLQVVGILTDIEFHIFIRRLRSIFIDPNNPNLTRETRDLGDFPGHVQRAILDKDSLLAIAVIRINIDGIWHINDLNEFLHDFKQLYTTFYQLYLINEYRVVLYTAGASSYRKIYAHSNLRVKKFHYASPGWFDFIGIGKVIDLIVSVFEKCIHWKQDLRIAKLKRTREEVKLFKEIRKDFDDLGLNETDNEHVNSLIREGLDEAMNWIDPEKVRGAVRIDPVTEDEITPGA